MPCKKSHRARPPFIAASLIALSMAAGCSSAHDESHDVQSAHDTPTTTRADNTATTSTSQTSPKVVLQKYFNAIGAGRFDEAYALWQTSTSQGPGSSAELKSQYAGVSAIRMEVTGDTRTEGAAGTVYATVPITLIETSGDGNETTRDGQCVLARTNNVPGSSEEDRRWHLHSCDLS